MGTNSPTDPNGSYRCGWITCQVCTHYLPKSLERVKLCLAEQGKYATHFQEFCQNCLKQSPGLSAGKTNFIEPVHLTTLPDARVLQHFFQAEAEADSAFLFLSSIGAPPRLKKWTRKVVLSLVKYGNHSITFYLHQWFATLEVYSNHLGLFSNTLELLESSPGDSGQPAPSIHCFFRIQDAPVEKYLHCAPRGGAFRETKGWGRGA